MEESFRTELQKIKAQAEIAKQEKIQAIREKEEMKNVYLRKTRLLEKEIELFDNFNKKNVFQNKQSDFKIPSMTKISNPAPNPPHNFPLESLQKLDANENFTSYQVSQNDEPLVPNGRLKSKTEFVSNDVNANHLNFNKYGTKVNESNDFFQKQNALMLANPNPQQALASLNVNSPEFEQPRQRNTDILEKLNNKKRAFSRAGKQTMSNHKYQNYLKTPRSRNSLRNQDLEFQEKQRNLSIRDRKHEGDSLQNFMTDLAQPRYPTFTNHFNDNNQLNHQDNGRSALRVNSVQRSSKENRNYLNSDFKGNGYSPFMDKMKFNGFDGNRDFSISKRDFEDESLKKLMEKYAGRF